MRGVHGIEGAREAGVMIEKAKARLDPEDAELSASIDLAEGIWNTVMAIRGAYLTVGWPSD